MAKLIRWKIFGGLFFVLIIIIYVFMSVMLSNGVTNADREPFANIPSDFNLPFDEVEFQSRYKDITLNGWYIPSPSQAKIKDKGGWYSNENTLILVHGLGSNRAGDNALDLVSRLRMYGFAALLFDLRGHGESGDGRVSAGYFEQNDVLGAFDFLTNKGVKPGHIGIVGFSMGAGTSLLAASNEPSIQATVSDSTYANAIDLMTQEVSRTTFLPAWIVPLFNPGTKIAADLLYDIKISELAPESAVTKINHPIFFIHGMEDSRIPASHSTRVHKASHNDSKLWLVPHTEHADSFYNYPEEYSEKVAEYLKGRLNNNAGSN